MCAFFVRLLQEWDKRRGQGKCVFEWVGGREVLNYTSVFYNADIVDSLAWGNVWVNLNGIYCEKNSAYIFIGERKKNSILIG